MILGKFDAEKKAHNYSISRDTNIILYNSISCLDWTTKLAGAKLAIYI
jgi:hypothetical protein